MGPLFCFDINNKDVTLSYIDSKYTVCSPELVPGFYEYMAKFYNWSTATVIITEESKGENDPQSQQDRN